MDRKTIYKKLTYTLAKPCFDVYDSDTGYRGTDLRDKIDSIVDKTKDKYKDYKLIKLISVLFPGRIIEDKMDYDYPLSNTGVFNFYSSFENYIYPNQKFEAKIGFVFEK